MWDALYSKHDLDVFEAKLSALKFPEYSHAPNPIIIWILPTVVVDSKLNTAEKSKHMTENIMRKNLLWILRWVSLFTETVPAFLAVWRWMEFIILRMFTE